MVMDFHRNIGFLNNIVFLDGNTSYVLVLLSKNLEDEIKGADLLAKVSLEIYNSLI